MNSAPTERTVLLSVIQDRWIYLQKRVKHCRSKLDEKAIHDVRVATRRLTAALTLVARILPVEKEEAPLKELRKLLKSFARLRDLQVSGGMLKQWDINGELSNEFSLWLQRSIRKEKRNVRDFLDEWNENKVGKKISDFIIRSNESLPMDSTEIKFATRIKKIMDTAFKTVELGKSKIDRLKPSTVHSFRISFKKYRYLIEAISMFDKRVTPEFIKRMQTFQATMGTLQDLNVLETKLETYRLKSRTSIIDNRLTRRIAIERKRVIEEVLRASKQIENFRPESKLIMTQKRASAR